METSVFFFYFLFLWLDPWAWAPIHISSFGFVFHPFIFVICDKKSLIQKDCIFNICNLILISITICFVFWQELRTKVFKSYLRLLWRCCQHGSRSEFKMTCPLGKDIRRLWTFNWGIVSHHSFSWLTSHNNYYSGVIQHWGKWLVHRSSKNWRH